MAAQKLTQTVIETAIKGGGGIVQTLQRSYSMNDLNNLGPEEPKKVAMHFNYTVYYYIYSVPKVVDFPRYNTKWRGGNKILRGIFHVYTVVSRFPIYFV